MIDDFKVLNQYYQSASHKNDIREKFISLEAKIHS